MDIYCLCMYAIIIQKLRKGVIIMDNEVCKCRECGFQWIPEEIGYDDSECPVCGSDDIINQNTENKSVQPVGEEDIERFIAENTWFTRKVYRLGRGVTLNGIIDILTSKKYSDVSELSSRKNDGDYKEYQFYNIRGSRNNKHYGEIISLKVVGELVVIQNGIDYINPPKPIYYHGNTDVDACRRVREENIFLHYLLFKDIDEFVEKMNNSFDAKVCPHCGEEITGKGKFCANCGLPLQ